MQNEITNQKNTNPVKVIVLTVLGVVAAVIAWPTIHNFVAHNTRTQVHRINR